MYFKYKNYEDKQQSKKLNNVLIKTSQVISEQNMDVMLSFLFQVLNRKMINCRHIPLNVFCKIFFFADNLCEKIS